MALSSRRRSEFVAAFAKVMLAAWSDLDYEARLTTDPCGALVEAGLPIPPGSFVRVYRPAPDPVRGPDLELQIALWERGLATGIFEFHVPAVQEIEATELSDAELVYAAAGGPPANPCCPCSSWA